MARPQREEEGSDFERISRTEEAILTALATYRFLTPKQMLAAGVTSSRNHLYDRLRTLKRRKPALLRELPFKANPGEGSLSSLYVLTPFGAELLKEHRLSGEEVKARKRVVLFDNDYHHRIACVDFHIALQEWAHASEHTVDFLHTYYDPGECSPRERALTLKTRVPLKKGILNCDIVFSLTDREGVRRLYVFEMYNKRRTHRVLGQLSTYLVAIDDNDISQAFNYLHSPRILLGFEDVEGMELVCQRVRPLPDFSRDRGLGKNFLLAAIATIRERFFDCWQYFDGTRARFY